MKRYLIQALFILVIGISVLSGCRNISTEYLASPTVNATETPTDTSAPAAIPTPALSPTPSPSPSPTPSYELSAAEKDKLISDYLNDVGSDPNAWVSSASGALTNMRIYDIADNGYAEISGKLLFIESYGTKDFLVLGVQNTKKKNVVIIIELITDIPADIEVWQYAYDCKSKQEYLSLLNSHMGSYIGPVICYEKIDLETYLKEVQKYNTEQKNTEPINIELETFFVNAVNSGVSAGRSLLKGIKKPAEETAYVTKKDIKMINAWKAGPMVTVIDYSQLEEILAKGGQLPIASHLATD